VDTLTIVLTAVGSIVGAGAASFTAVWKFLVVPNRVEVEKAGLDKGEIEHLQEELRAFKSKTEARRGNAEKDQAVLTERVEGLVSRMNEAKEALGRLEGKMSTFVTDEEWQAGQNQTQQSVNSLTERVGRTMGAIEAWQTRGAR
jgi:DNA repair exonuclease SbcCD ATPase subunit